MRLPESELRVAGDPADLIGRAAERSSILAALGVDGASSAAVILTGEVGIGKTAIWESIVADRSSAGEHVLISRATVAEARLPWVGLADLLRSIPLTAQARLPEVQQRALKAVSLQHGGADALDERTVGTAIFSALQIMTESAPVLLAVDDLPYLDVASAFVVAFALRRLEGPHPARLLATVRGHDLQLPVVRGLPADRSTAIDVGPLTLGALFALLRQILPPPG
jgi:AAA ATPase domain